jgi:Sec7-like guanine-nucleotide exchange factor
VFTCARDANHAQAILHKYVDSFEFAGLELDIALRSYVMRSLSVSYVCRFLYQFHIPGEAAIIDRILVPIVSLFTCCSYGRVQSQEKFAERYFAQNSRTIFQVRLVLHDRFV